MPRELSRIGVERSGVRKKTACMSDSRKRRGVSAEAEADTETKTKSQP